MKAENTIKILFNAMEEHWPFVEPHIEYSTNGYLFFRQNGSISAVPLPIKGLMTEKIINNIPEEAFIDEEEINSVFFEFIRPLIKNVDEGKTGVVRKTSVEKEKEEKKIKDNTKILKIQESEIKGREEMDDFVFKNSERKNIKSKHSKLLEVEEKHFG